MKRLAIGICVLAMALTLSLAGCNSTNTCDPYGGPYIDNQPPAVPTCVTSITGDTYVIVEWNPVEVDDIEGYGVYRSREYDGTYMRIGDVAWDEPTEFWDEGLTNGVTYFYAVDAYDISGNVSDLSYEWVDDTPRPEGWDMQWMTRQFEPDEAGIAIIPDQYDSIVILPYNSFAAQYYLSRPEGGLMRIVPLKGNQLQDFGFTYSEDDISEAPLDGWSSDPNGVEVILEHTYILRTTAGYYGKIRVETMGPNWAVVYWAYQGQQWNTELAPRLVGATP
jgi:hypothetical protein